MGEMADLLMYEDPLDCDDSWEPPSLVACKYCNEGGLMWAPSFPMPPAGPWRLLNSEGQVHSCKEYWLKEGV